MSSNNIATDGLVSRNNPIVASNENMANNIFSVHRTRLEVLSSEWFYPTLPQLTLLELAELDIGRYFSEAQLEFFNATIYYDESYTVAYEEQTAYTEYDLFFRFNVMEELKNRIRNKIAKIDQFIDLSMLYNAIPYEEVVEEEHPSIRRFLNLKPKSLPLFPINEETQFNLEEESFCQADPLEYAGLGYQSKVHDYSVRNNCCYFCPHYPEPWDPDEDIIVFKDQLLCLPSRCRCVENDVALRNYQEAIMYNEDPGDFIPEILQNCHGRVRVLLEHYLMYYHTSDIDKLIVIDKYLNSVGQIDFDFFGIKRLSSSIDKININTREVISDVLEPALIAFNANLSSVAKSADTFASGITATGGVFNSLLEYLKDTTKGPLFFLVFYAILEILGREERFRESITILKFVIAGAGLVYYSWEPIKELVVRWVGVGQSASDWGSLIAEAASFLLFGKNVSLTGIEDFGRSLSSIAKSTEAFEKVASKVIDWFKRFLILVSDTFNLNIADWFRSKDNRLHQLQKEVDEILKEYISNPLKMSMQTAERVQKVSMQVLDMKVSLPAIQANQPILIALERLSDKILSLLKFASDSGVVLGERDEPLLLVSAGAVGVGKTFFCDFLAQFIALRSCSKEELLDVMMSWKNEVYVWPVDNKHHDQYKGQEVILFPDLFCQTDAEGQPGEAANIVFLAGSQPMTLPAAELIKKEKLYVISRAIVACTNVLYIHQAMFKSVRNPDAVRRRLNKYGYYQWVNPKYALLDGSGRVIIDKFSNRLRGYENDDYLYAQIDPDKLPKNIKGLPDDIWFFRKLNFSEGTFADDIILSQKAYFEMVDAALKKSRVAGARKREQMKEEAERIIKEMTGESQTSEALTMKDPTFADRMKSLEMLDDPDTSYDDNYVHPAETNISVKRKNILNKKKRCAQMDEFVEARSFQDAADLIYDPRSYMDLIRDTYGFVVNGQLPISEEVFNRAQALYKTIVVDGTFGAIQDNISLQARVAIRNMELPSRVGDIISSYMERVDVASSPRIHLEEQFWMELLDDEQFEPFAAFSFKYVRIMMKTSYYNLQKNFLNFYYASHIKDPILRFVMQTQGVLTSFKNEISRCCNFVSSQLIGFHNYLNTFPAYRSFEAHFFASLGTAAGIYVPLTIAMGVIRWIFRPTCAQEEALRLRNETRRLDNEEQKLDLELKKANLGPIINPAQALSGENDDLKFIEGYVGNFFLLFVQRVSVTGTQLTHPMNLIFLGNKTAVTVNHGIEFIKKFKTKYPDDQIVINLTEMYNGDPKNSTLRFRIEDLEFPEDEKLKSLDLGIIKFRSIAPKPCLRNFIPPQACLQWITQKTDLLGRFMYKRVDKNVPIGVPEYVPVRMNMNSSSAYWIKMEKDGETMLDLGLKSFPCFSLRGVRERLETEGGMCGSPTWLIDSRKNYCTNLGWPQAQQPWLIYIHNSSQLLVPHGAPIYRELFENYFEEMKIKPRSPIEEIKKSIDDYVEEFTKEGFCQTAPIVIETEHQTLDQFHTSFANCTPVLGKSQKSEITKSPLYGLFPITRVPSRLRSYTDKKSGEFVDVMKKAREVYGSNTFYYNEQLYDSIIHDTLSRIMSESTVPVNREVLTFEEAIYGAVAYNLAPIDWNTSAGATLRIIFKSFGIKSKGKQFFAQDGKPTEQGLRMIRNLLDKHMNRLKEGGKFGNIFTDNLKDELLKFEKVLAGKTRLFCSCDFIFLIACRMYFGAFAGWIMDNKINNGISIGVNPYGKDWDALFAFLTKYLNFIFGDYGKFDKKQKDILMRACLTLIHMYYNDYDTPEYDVRERLFEEIMYSIHLTIDDVKMWFYEWTHGNTSGNFLTAIINSIVNICIIHIALCLAEMLYRGKNIFKSLDYNFKEVSESINYNVLGDDIALGLKPKPWNTFSILKKIIETQLGLEFTDELKGDATDVPDYRDITDGSYLGRKFKPEIWCSVPKVYSPLRLYSVIECVMWLKGQFDPKIEVEKIESVNIELCQYDVETFNHYAKPLAEACLLHYGVYPKYSDYNSARVRLSEMINYKYSFDHQYLLLDEDNIESLGTEEFRELVLDLSTNSPGLSEKHLESSFGCEGSAFSSFNTATDCNIFVSNIFEQAPEAGVGVAEATPSPGMNPGLCYSVCEFSVSSNTHFCQSEMLDNSGGDFDTGATVQTMATTQFLEAAAMVHGAVSQPTTKVSTYVEEMTTIKDFLEKPQLLTNGQWTNAQSANTNLANASIKSYLSSVAIWSEKIKGFNLIRGDFIITVEINASPFQQGKLLLHYLPCYSDFVNINTGYGKMHNSNLLQKIQHPHVQIDCRRTAAAMRVPYVAPTHFYAIKEAQYDWGTWFLDVLAPLKTGSAAPAGQAYVDYVIYGHWENVELAAPSVAQSSILETPFPNPETHFCQGRRVKRGGDVETKENTGPITFGLKKLGKVADVLTDVPIIGEIASTVSWISDIASNVTSIFGWSKPRVNDGVTIVSNQLFRYAGTTDGPDTSIPGGVSCQNRLELIDYASYTNEDEMALKYLLRIPTFYRSVNWAYGAGQGTSLYSEAIGPGMLYNTGTDTVGAHTATIKYTAPLCYLAQIFGQWRGSILVTLKFAKTQMHSGRLQVTWTPSNQYTVSPTISTGSYSLRTIIDLRNEDEVTLELPYLVLSDYLSLESGFNGTSGGLDIVVLNDLRAPESCADNIDILMFFSAGDDFEFAVPKHYTDGCMAYVPQSGNLELEMHGVGQDLALPTVTVGGISTVKDKVLHASRCVGEKIMSIKNLLNRNSILQAMNNTLVWNNSNYWIKPWFVPACTLTAVTGTIKVPFLGGDTYSFLAPMYAFYRGGARISMIDYNASNTHGTCILPSIIGDTGTQPLGVLNSTDSINISSGTTLTPYGGQVAWPTEPLNIQDQRANFIQHVPYYNRYPFSLVTYYDTVATPGADRSMPKSLLCFTSSSNVSTICLQRSFMDDLQLSFFIGCPPLMSNYT